MHKYQYKLIEQEQQNKRRNMPKKQEFHQGHFFSGLEICRK